MGTNEPVLDLALVSRDAARGGDLHNIIGKVAQRLTFIAPLDVLQECGGSCEHALLVVDGYALGTESLMLCRKLRLAGFSRPIVLAWRHNTALDRAVCREYGADEIIFRPFVASKVLLVILSAASNWQPGIGGPANHRGRQHPGDEGILGPGFAGVLGAAGGRTELRTP